LSSSFASRLQHRLRSGLRAAYYDDDHDHDHDHDRFLLEKENEPSKNEDDNDNDDDDAFRILYIVTSSGRSYQQHRGSNGVDRWYKMIIPVLKQNIESYSQENDNENNSDHKNKKYRVDLYVITSYTLSQEDKDTLRQSLPPSTGIQYWSDALPLMYHCKDFLNEPASTRFNECILASESDRLQMGQMALANNTDDGRRPDVRLRDGKAQLAKQHRLVVKDKLPYYDFFVVMEDDMLYTKSHVETYLRVLSKVNKLKAAAKEYESSIIQSNTTRNRIEHKQPPLWNSRLRYKDLKRMRAGFVRVEVLGESYEKNKNCVPKKLRPDWSMNENNTIAIPEPIADNAIDAKTCCKVMVTEDTTDASINTSTNTHNNTTTISTATNSTTPTAKSTATTTTTTTPTANSIATTSTITSTQQLFTDKPDPIANDLVLWETKAIGFSLRPWVPITPNNNSTDDTSTDTSSSSSSSSSWFATPLLGLDGFPAYWIGHQITDRYTKEFKTKLPQGNFAHIGGGKYAAQGGGWMGSSAEIMEYHADLCPEDTGTSFLPPFNNTRHPRDGLRRHNVEYWSGGIQIYSDKACGVQRVYEMESASEFSKHLVYHASNNKQCTFKFLQEAPLVPGSIRPDIDLLRESRLSKRSSSNSSEASSGEAFHTKLFDNILNINTRLVRVQNLWNQLTEARDGIIRDYREDNQLLLLETTTTQL